VDPGFEDGGQVSTTTTRPRSGLPSIYPRLAYQDEALAFLFLTRAFGLRERWELRKEGPEGMLAWLQMGDGVVMIGRANHDVHRIYSPRETGRITGMVNVEVEDVDAHYARAFAAGARIALVPEDMPWGLRRYEALDLEGQRWHFYQRLSDG
jgi:uncharacterized glyoxalase superfamily protein PhnB